MGEGATGDLLTIFNQVKAEKSDVFPPTVVLPVNKASSHFDSALCVSRIFAVFALACSVAPSLAAASPSDSSSQRYERGKQLLNQGRYEEAAVLFREVAQSPTQDSQTPAPSASPKAQTKTAHRAPQPVAREPIGFARAKLARWNTDEGKSALENKEYLAAIAHAQRALELDPALREAKELLSKAQRAYGDEQAKVRKKELIIAKAREAENQGNIRKSMALWKQASGLDPQDAQVSQGLKQAQAKWSVAHPALQHATDLTRASASGNPAALTEPYHVSIGDVLEVFVWQQPDLSRDVVVRPDGRISFPLVGDVDAVGLPLTDLDKILTDKLKTYVRYPDVSLAIKRFGGTKTIVLGEVGRPGIYVPTGEGRVLDVIAMAGGFLSNADTKDVVLIRGGLASPQMAALDIQSTLTRGNLTENVLLEPNDILYVARQGKTTWGNVKAVLEEISPILNETLIFQSVATNFGAREFQRTGRSTGVE